MWAIYMSFHSIRSYTDFCMFSVKTKYFHTKWPVIWNILIRKLLKLVRKTSSSDSCNHTLTTTPVPVSISLGRIKDNNIRPLSWLLWETKNFTGQDITIYLCYHNLLRSDVYAILCLLERHHDGVVRCKLSPVLGKPWTRHKWGRQRVLSSFLPTLPFDPVPSSREVIFFLFFFYLHV